VVRIIAICTQPVLLVVSWVTRNLFIGVDGLDVRAGAVFLAHHGRGAIVGRFGGSILGSHVGRRKGEDWKGCLQQSEGSKSRRAIRVSGSRRVVGKEEENITSGGGADACITNARLRRKD
jgi:hypothetical protein